MSVYGYSPLICECGTRMRISHRLSYFPGMEFEEWKKRTQAEDGTDPRRGSRKKGMRVMPQDGERRCGHGFRMLGNGRRPVSGVRMPVLRPEDEDPEAGHRGDRGSGRKGKTPGQREKQKIIDILPV